MEWFNLIGPSRRRLLSLAAGILVLAGFLIPQQPPSLVPLSDTELTAKAEQVLWANSTDWNIGGKQFSATRTYPSIDGLVTIRFQQLVDSIPVLNSFLSITLTQEGGYLSHVAKLSQLAQAPKIQTSQHQAAQIAAKQFARTAQINFPDVVTDTPRLYLLDPELTDLKLNHPILAWQSNVHQAGNPLSTSVLTFADETKRVIANRSLVKFISNSPIIYVCDLQKSKPSSRFTPLVSTMRIGNLPYKYIGKSSAYPLCEVNDPGRIKSATASSVKSMVETVSYFRNQIGVDISDEKYLGNIAPYANFGKNLTAKTYCNKNPKSKYCVPTISGHTNVCSYDSYYRDVECPMNNAYWVPWPSNECRSGACSAMFFGKGFDKADDVVAHELTHGVTSGEAFFEGVCSNCDADAISEAISDFFGEAVDQFTVTKGELPDPDWNMGEDIGGDPVRNMAMVGKFEPCGSNPGWSPIRQIDDLWNTSCDSHTTLGPADRFAWLISNGGVQNGISISPIGTAPWSSAGKYELCNKTGSNCTALVNMTRLAFRTLPYLNGNTSYSDFGFAINQACQDLLSAKKRPFQVGYCDQVKNALVATGISSLQISNVTRVNAWTNSSQIISARFGNPTGVASTGVNLILQFRPIGKTSWQNLDSATTDNLGVANFQVTFPSQGSYRVSTVPASNVGTYSSSIINVS